ncbi:hypothetical protein AAY473_015087 [Plecturocebus cupreus]
MGFHHVAQACFKLLGSSDPPTLASQSRVLGLQIWFGGAYPDSSVSDEVTLDRLGDSRRKSPTGHQRDSFGRRGCFAGALAPCFSVQSIRDWVLF